MILAGIFDAFIHMDIVLQNSTEKTKVVFGLWMTVNFPAVSPFPSCPVWTGVRQPKPWAWGSAEPWELARLAEDNGLASPGSTRVPRDRLLSCDLWLAAALSLSVLPGEGARFHSHGKKLGVFFWDSGLPWA